MTRTLYLAWQSPGPGNAWFPVGRLDTDRQQGLFWFTYVHGAWRAAKKAGFRPPMAFPNFRARYEAGELFPLFKNRVLDFQRKDFPDYLRTLALDSAHPDPVEILALSGGELQTDNFEVFPRLEMGPDNRFRCRFFLHGLRYLSEEVHKVWPTLMSDEPLQVALELNNPATGIAVQLATRRYEVVGWAPRYLVDDLVPAVGQHQELSARVVRNNEAETPPNRRILVEMNGVVAPGHKMMAGPDFQPI